MIIASILFVVFLVSLFAALVYVNVVVPNKEEQRAAREKYDKTPREDSVYRIIEVEGPPVWYRVEFNNGGEWWPVLTDGGYKVRKFTLREEALREIRAYTKQDEREVYRSDRLLIENKSLKND